MTTAEQMPEPAFRLKWRSNDAAYFVDKPNIGDTDCYTFEQLRAYAAQEVAREREACAVAAWSHYMDTCKAGGIGPAVYNHWCAASAIRARNA